MSKDREVRVRYAPSPTGHLHIGNARTAIFNYLFARHNKGKFIIRIEDTDTKRNVKNGEKSQLENLKWLGLDWDEGPDIKGKYGPYRQSERQNNYDKLISQLLNSGQAYESYKTEEELQNQREQQKQAGVMPHYEYEFAGMSDAERQAAIAKAKKRGLKPVIRFRVPKNHNYQWNDMVKGKIEVNSDTIGGDFVIAKRDGTPTYNFAVVADDHAMDITHVFRGDDHIPNTPKQLMLYEALDWQPPKFGHMSLITSAETGKKLSKRDETIIQFIEQYRELGYLPDAMFNFITLLGWSPKGEKEIFNRNEFIKMYDENRLSKSPAKFDEKKLEWINNQYVKASDEDKIMHLALEELIKDKLVVPNPNAQEIEWNRKLITLFKKQMSYMSQISDLAKGFFKPNQHLNEAELQEVSSDTANQVLKEFTKRIKETNIFDKTNLLKIIKSIQRETKIKGRKLWMPIRIAATHSMHGPELPETMELLGKERVLSNIQETLKEIKKTE